MELDESYEVAKGIFSDAIADFENVKSEEDAKFRVIARLLTEALNWVHNDIASERPNENGYSDYLISDGQSPAFVIEAKKLGLIDITTQEKTKQTYKISGPALRGALKGTKQVASYCNPLGIPLAVLTDGFNWIVFLPYIPGGNYADKQAIVFPGFDAVISDYATFFELLSKKFVRKHTYRLIFDKLHENRLLQTAVLTAPFPLGDIVVEQKSAIAFDLEKVFSKFFSGLAGDDDPDLLINCFVESRESRIADFTLERITSNVLGNINPKENSVDEGLNSIIKNTVEGELGQTIFIVGSSGAGKTTFLDRFFRKTLAKSTRERCVVININSLDASGDEKTSITWMTEKIIEAIEKQIFSDGFPVWDELLSLYHLEYIKRSKGVDSKLYIRDKDAFKEKFGLFLDEQVTSDREGYLSRLLRDVVKNRKRLPIFVVDNTDEFGMAYKEKVFQYFQALRRSTEHCLLIFPATDRSAWAFSKTDIFNIYSSKSFYLPTPSPREVFRKRVEYLRGKLSPQDNEKTKSAYFTRSGIKVTIADLSAFAAVVENVFVDQDYAAKRIGEISNYNMRKTLSLCRRVITASSIRVEDVIGSYIAGAIVNVAPEKFMNALLRGDYSMYRPDDDHHIFPIFQVDSKIRQSPLLSLRVLLLLRSAHTAASEDADRYLNVKSIYSFFDLMSCSESAVENSVIALFAAGLVEPYDLSMKEYTPDQKLAITYSGISHIELAMYNPTFFEQMALTTRVNNSEIAAQIRSTYLSQVGIFEKMERVRDLFASFIVTEDERNMTVPSISEFSEQFSLRSNISSQWSLIKKVSAQVAPTQAVLAASCVVASVVSFNHSKGFGFVNVPEIMDTAFIHVRSLKTAGFSDVFDGDDLLCDIARGEKGLIVSAVYEVVHSNAKIYKAVIVKMVNDRHFGFVHVAETGMDALFHFSLFPPEYLDELVLGMDLTVEIRTEGEGRNQVRRVVEYPQSTV